MSTNHPLRLPEIRLPRMPEVPMTKLPEIRIPERAKLSSHHSEILSQKDITPSDVRDRPASSLGFESPKNSRNESKRASSSLETSYGSPKNTRISPLDPPRKRSSSSSWIGPTSSISSSSSSSSSTYNPSASTPSLPLPSCLMESPKRTNSLSSLFQPSPLSSVSSLLEEQAESSMQAIPSIPSFSQKIPLKREKSDVSEKMDDSKSDGPRSTSPLVDKKQKRKSPLSKTKVKPIKLEQETLSKSEEDIEKKDEETQQKTKEKKKEKTKDKTKDKPKEKTKEKTKQQTEELTEEQTEEQTKEETKEERKENGTKVQDAEIEKEEKIETAGMFKSKSTWILPTAAPTETPFQRCMKNLNIRVFVSTWNMQGKPPPASGLELLITPHTHDRALLSPPKQKWEDKLSSMLGSEYIMLPTATLGAVHLAVFVHASLIPIISDIRTGSIPTGLGNVVANKGGVAVTFYVGTSSFAFVTAHFTAHHNKVEQRNADFHRINNMITLSSPNQPAPLSLPLPLPSSSSPSIPSLTPSSSAPSSSSSTPSSTPPAQRKKEKRSSRESSIVSAEETPQQATENKEPPKTEDTQDTKTQDTQETNPQEAQEPKTGEPQDTKAQESQETKIQDTTTQDTKIQDTQEPQTQETQEPQQTKQQETKTPDKQEKKSRRRSSLLRKSSLTSTQEDPQNTTTQGPNAMTQSQTQLPRMPQAGASILERFDRVFWSGDLNYRINGNKKIVEETIKQNLVEVLVANDQLTIERKKGSVFQGFLEGPLNFIPTYKYDSGSDTFDTSAKARVPSWTDRILFKTSEHVILHEYLSCAGLKYTDHRPVYASFEVGFDPPDLSGGNQVGSGGAAGSKVCTIL